MIKLKDVVINTPATIGTITLLTDVRPVYNYVNGTRTAEILGYRYEVALPERHLNKLEVFIEGQQRMEAPDGNAPVVFEGLELYLGWSRDNSYVVRARASEVSFAPSPKK